jgi:hypothetical protein
MGLAVYRASDSARRLESAFRRNSNLACRKPNPGSALYESADGPVHPQDSIFAHGTSRYPFYLFLPPNPDSTHKIPGYTLLGVPEIEETFDVSPYKTTGVLTVWRLKQILQIYWPCGILPDVAPRL